MRIINTEEEYIEAIREEQPMPASVMKTGLWFQHYERCILMKDKTIVSLAA